MITNEESRIVALASVGTGGKVLPPCGWCREFVYQINHDNLEADVLIGEDKVVKLKELLPHLTWDEPADAGLSRRPPRRRFAPSG